MDERAYIWRLPHLGEVQWPEHAGGSAYGTLLRHDGKLAKFAVMRRESARYEPIAMLLADGVGRIRQRERC